MALTPSQSIIDSANAVKTVTDTKGRKITFRRLGALDRARIFKAAGPVNSQNAPYIGMSMIACSCTDVDGVPIPFPSKESEIDAAIARLDDPGMNAIAEEFAKEMEDGDSASSDTPSI